MYSYTYIHIQRNSLACTSPSLTLTPSIPRPSTPITPPTSLKPRPYKCSHMVCEHGDAITITNKHTHTRTHKHTHAQSTHKLRLKWIELIHKHTATHCNTLQHTATHCNSQAVARIHQTHTPPLCNTLQHSATLCNTHPATHCNTLQHTATHCYTLLHTAPHCYTLQHTATHKLWLGLIERIRHLSATLCNILQHFATHSLQHTATHCNTLQHTATHCYTLLHTATHCNSQAVARIDRAHTQTPDAAALLQQDPVIHSVCVCVCA